MTKAKAKPPSRAHVPTEASRRLVKELAALGCTHDYIGSRVGLCADALRNHYRAELDHGVQEANGTIARALFDKAKNGDTACMIFWLKTRARWREVARPDDEDETPPPTRVVVEVRDASRPRADS